MSTKHSELVANAVIRLQSADEAIQSLEYTHNWETALRKSGDFFSEQVSGFYSWGYHLYTVNNSGFDLTYHWGSGFASSKLFVGDGNDKIFGNIGSDKVHTGGGNDIIRGGAGDDQLVGGDGNNIIYGDEGNDILYGGDGNDKITGAKGDDVLHGHKGNEKLKGKAGNDRLVGNEGNDVLYGGAGDDILVGGAGLDIMVGGKGDDTFYIGDLASSVRLADVIKDYGKGNNMLSFVTGTHTVQVKNTGKDTILLNGTGDDAEIYAILRGYTDPLTIDDADGITFIEIV